MSNDFLDAARDLGLENDPTILALSNLLKRQPYDPFGPARAYTEHTQIMDERHKLRTDDSLAFCKRLGEQIDSVLPHRVVAKEFLP